MKHPDDAHKHSTLHPKHVGFKGAVSAVQKEGYSKESAARIIGYNKAHASASARRKNPRLNK